MLMVLAMFLIVVMRMLMLMFPRSTEGWRTESEKEYLEDGSWIEVSARPVGVRVRAGLRCAGVFCVSTPCTAWHINKIA